MNYLNKKEKGFTLIEILISIAIISLIIGAVGAFQAGIFKSNRLIQSGLLNQQQAKKLIRPFAEEVRGANISSQGAYPIETATDITFSFYTDINNDGLTEKIEYYVENGEFIKSVIEPDPITYEYNEENTEVTKVIRDIIEGPTFYYYGDGYTGSSTSTPLTSPVTPNEIKVVKVVVRINSSDSSEVEPFEVSTQVTLRNLGSI
jgi:prepilin-type N-terminal cleavage/methylation domain-containing protein